MLAPLAADGMMFFPVSDSGIFSSASRTEEKGYVIMPDEEAVKCVADGSILASYYSASGSGYVIIIQHAKGFVTRIARVGSPMVSAGDAVTGGQVIALAPSPDAKGKRYVEVMMWHNGLPLIPYEYIGNPESMIIKDAPFERASRRLGRNSSHAITTRRGLNLRAWAASSSQLRAAVSTVARNFSGCSSIMSRVWVPPTRRLL